MKRTHTSVKEGEVVVPEKKTQVDKLTLILPAGDEDFQDHLTSAGEKFLVALFYKKEGCDHSVKSLAEFPQTAELCSDVANFVQVDLDDSSASKLRKTVKESPSYIIYQNGNEVDTMKGFNPWELRSKISKLCGKSYQTGNIFYFIDENISECLNGSDDTPFPQFLNGKCNLVSDCDEQLLLAFGFNQRVKINSLKIKAPADRGPKTLKLFVNQTKTLGFDDAASFTPAQTVTLSSENLMGTNEVELHTVKFQNVINLQVLVVDNMEGGEVTEIQSIELIGAPLGHANMRKGGSYTIDVE